MKRVRRAREIISQRINSGRSNSEPETDMYLRVLLLFEKKRIKEEEQHSHRPTPKKTEITKKNQRQRVESKNSAL